jgi:hypothetical protein
MVLLVIVKEEADFKVNGPGKPGNAANSYGLRWPLLLVNMKRRRQLGYQAKFNWGTYVVLIGRAVRTRKTRMIVVFFTV